MQQSDDGNPNDNTKFAPNDKKAENINVISEFANQNRRTVHNDDLANQEREHLFSDGERGEKFRRHLHRIALISIYIMASILVSLIAVRAWHFAVPEHLKWLDISQLHDIERIIFSGAILSFAGRYFKRYNLLGDEVRKK